MRAEGEDAKKGAADEREEQVVAEGDGGTDGANGAKKAKAEEAKAEEAKAEKG